MTVRVQSQAFDIGAETAAFAAARVGIGAIVTFTGVVRDRPAAGQGAGLIRMEIEHYPGMTESAIAEIVDQATARWSLADCLVIHRHGSLAPGAPIMMVATAATHRTAAFEAAEFLMDYLKSRAPFWKKEIAADGVAWVDATEADEEALRRWRD